MSIEISNRRSLLFTVWMIVRSPQVSIRTDHVEDHPLLHGDAFIGESGLLETCHHSGAVVAPPREDGGGEEESEGEI